MGKQLNKINVDGPTQRHKLILCRYSNTTSRPQIVRVENVRGWFLERVVTSGGTIIFEAPITAQLEVFSSEAVTTAIYDRIWCRQLQFCQDADVKTERRNERRQQRNAASEKSRLSIVHTA